MTLKVYGADWCGDCIRTKKFLANANVPFDYVDLVKYPQEKSTAIDISGSTHIPVVVFEDGSFLVEPSNNDLAEKLGK